jgi:hypothetical protein
MTRYRKSWTQVIEEVILNEALKPLDKSVVDAFYYKKEKAGKVVSTDGDSLWKNGLGGQEIAIWSGRKIKITAVSDVKSTEAIIKYIKKSIPSGILEEIEATRMPMEAPFVLDEDEDEGYVGTKKKKQMIKKHGYSDQHPKKDKFSGYVEGVELDEMKWAVGGVYHQEYKNGDKTYFRADSVQKNKRWKGMSVDEISGKQSKAKNNTADERVQGWETTPKNEIPKGLKEEVEVDEAKGTAYPATIDTLRKIVKDKQNQVVMFKSGQARVDLFTASAMVQVYDALKKPDMKKHFEKMITDKAGFLKTQAFAMKMIG